jgi:hypothetical protein
MAIACLANVTAQETELLTQFRSKLPEVRPSFRPFLPRLQEVLGARVQSLTLGLGALALSLD